MLLFTNSIVASSAAALASEPPTPPPTPSATIIRYARRCSPTGKRNPASRLVVITSIRLWIDAIR